MASDLGSFSGAAEAAAELWAVPVRLQLATPPPSNGGNSLDLTQVHAPNTLRVSFGPHGPTTQQKHEEFHA
jgi:hypothetical protein